ncbi:glycosyltransferase [Rhodococcus qingshengii]|nr:glycosyltransferase [Rhodococcus qingshengii]
MKISVIIPVYNVEKYLTRCIESVINQSYKDIEIVLINDGSPDSSGDICDYYASNDSRIRVIHKKNEGVSQARNSGLEVINGEYIFFLDSDDYIEEDAISKFSKRAKETAADIIIGNYKIINENNEITVCDPFDTLKFANGTINKSTDKFKYFFGKSFGRNVWNKLYNTKLVKDLNILFEREINYGEDFLFNLKLFINYPNIELLNEYTYYYFINKGSITNTYQNNLTKSNLLLLEKFHSYAKEQNKLNDNKDLIAFLSFTLIDNSSRNCFEYSRNKFGDMKKELCKFRNSNIIKDGLRDLLDEKYIKEVTNKEWKYYAWIFTMCYNSNLINLSTLFQIFRFKLKKLLH